MLKFNLNVAERKTLAKRLEELTGIHPIYTRAPLYAYEVGDYTIDRDGNLLVDETLADQEVLGCLLNEGVITGGEIVGENDGAAGQTELTEESETVEQDEPEDDTPAEQEQDTANADEPEATAEESSVAEEFTEETEGAETEAEEDSAAGTSTEESASEEVPLDLNISLPMENHNGVSLRNLVNLIYSRASLINKATGSHFHVDEELVEALKDDACTYTVANFRKALADYEEAHGESGMDGFLIEEDKVTFCGFPTAPDVEHLTAFGQLVVLMNNQAITQKRIQAKTVNEDNEKYAMRIWLIRLGMNGDDFKATRKIIMKNLGGHTAFRTEEEAEKAKQKALAKRQREKAAVQAVAEPAADTEQVVAEADTSAEPEEIPNF